MAMREPNTRKGGTTMVTMTDRWIGCGSAALVLACPRQEFVRRA